MNGRVLKYGLVVLTLSVATLSAQTHQAKKCVTKKTTTQKTKTTYDLSAGTIAGETLRGPRTIEATGINTIRYDYEFGNSATYGTAPDLWTGLTALATTQATQAPAAPVGPTTPKEMTERKPAAQVAVDDPTAKLQAAINAADAHLAAVPGLTTVQVRVTKILSDLFKETTTLHKDQIQANSAIGLVSQAKLSLTNYLQASTNDISDLVQTTTAETTPSSDFEQGIGSNAAWPGAQATTHLSQLLAGTADKLTAETAASAIYLPTLTASMPSLTAALATLKSALVTYNKNSTNPDPSKVAAEQAEEGKLQAAITFVNGLASQLTLASAQSASAVTAAAALLPQSPTYIAFASDQEILLRWNAKMKSKLTAWNEYTADTTTPKTKPNPFAKTADPATCEFAFATTKDTVVTLTRLDLTPGVQNPAPQTMLTVKVECTSPFSIAAGVVFSTIPDRSFSIAATPVTPATNPPTTQSTFTQTEGSNFHPLPLAMIHVRLHEWNDSLAFYGSFGVAANIRSPTSGGSAAEYLIGPSIGFFRTAFLTAGVHLGNEPNIGNGYAVGGVVPTGVLAVPISTTYRPGFGLGITFTKP